MYQLIITPGDPAGIGPEVTAKALQKIATHLSRIKVTLVGRSDFYIRKFKIPSKIDLEFIEPAADLSGGAQAGWAIMTATRMALLDPKHIALITGPIHKARLQDGGYPFNGHTDFIANLCKAKNPTMMLANQHFKVALVTGHIPLSSVSQAITPNALLECAKNTHRFLHERLGIRKPKIAVLGLNPHAGESGRIGNEETNTLQPVMALLKNKFGADSFTGPHPADSFFGLELNKLKTKRHDAVIALYHDQGLIPVKLLGYHNSINLTLGLPIIRTSVDHGTAFDIVGKNLANSQSMELATLMAIKLLKGNKK